MSDFLDYLKKNLDKTPKAVLYNKNELLTSATKKVTIQSESVKLNTIKTEVTKPKEPSEYNIASMILEGVPADFKKHSSAYVSSSSDSGGRVALSTGQVVEMQVSKKDANLANQLLNNIDF